MEGHPVHGMKFFRLFSSQTLLPLHVSMIHEVQIISFWVSPAAPSILQVHKEHMTSEINEFSSAFVCTEFEWYQQTRGGGSWQLRLSLHHLLQPLSVQGIFLCCSDPAAFISTIKPPPQPCALFSVCLPAFFVCFPLQICRCHPVLDEERYLCPFPGTPGTGMKQRLQQEPFSWLRFPLNPRIS